MHSLLDLLRTDQYIVPGEIITGGLVFGTDVIPSSESGKGIEKADTGPVGFPDLQALELILSQNIIKPQTTDNQVQITI